MQLLFITQLCWFVCDPIPVNKLLLFSVVTFGFKSEVTPPQHDGIKYFEQDLYKMVRRIQIRSVKSSFQSQLLADVKTTRKSTSAIVQAEKTTNLYKMSLADFNKLLNDNITAKYKKNSADTVSTINNEAKTIAREIQLDSRIEPFFDKNAFATMKDYKKKFLITSSAA